MIQLYGDFSFFDDEKEKEFRGYVSKALQQKVSEFYKCPEQDQLWSSSTDRGQEIAAKYDVLVVVGIGGSSLGGRAIEQAFSHRSDKKLWFIDNVDDFTLNQMFAKISDLQKVHWLLVSKSGRTLETLTLADYIDQRLRENDLKIVDHSTVVADDIESSLVQWAKSEEVPHLSIPGPVGGRFSVLTPVGLVPAAFLGLDLEAMREGARWSLNQELLLARWSAYCEQTFKQQRFITAMWFYSDRLQQFSRWTQQLWAESLAKKVDRQGQPAPQVSVPLPLTGTVDQHSVLQQLAEGKEKKAAWFFKVNEKQIKAPCLKSGYFTDLSGLEGRHVSDLMSAFAESTRESLEEFSVSTLKIEIDELGEKQMGALFMAMMTLIATLGECLNIDAFDQPGVELGKSLVRKYL